MRTFRLVRHLLLLAFLTLSTSSQAPAQQADNDKNNIAAKSEAALKRDAKRARSRARAGSVFPCTSRMPTEYFFVDFSGSISNIGRTYEGPLCIVIFHNPIQQFIGLQTSTSAVNGPDMSKIVLGGSSAGGEAPVRGLQNTAALSDAVAQLASDARTLTSKLAARRQDYSGATQSEDQAISSISFLRQTTMLLGGLDAIARVRNGYQALRDTLSSALNATTRFVPSDRADNNREILLAIAQAQEDRLNGLPLDYIEGAPTSFECDSHIQVGWSTWFAKCKDAVYTPLKAILDANLQAAKDLANETDSTKALIKRIAIVQYWNALFSSLGLRTSLLNAEIEALDISPAFYTRTAAHCGLLFNQTSNTAINIVAADLTPTLQGNDPNIKAHTSFVTVSCGTPFAVSAGVGFNTIEQEQFAILQSPDGKGGAINTFGTTSDSKVTPVALAVVHARLSEWDRHKFAFYGSLGIGGSLQNQSNSSPVQFLPGVSVSFWRTMYLTMGADIGNRTSLTGGFKVGDTVPAAVTSINGVIKTSRAVGFGFSVTFTKP
jgi:hypothetical protein